MRRGGGQVSRKVAPRWYAGADATIVSRETSRQFPVVADMLPPSIDFVIPRGFRGGGISRIPIRADRATGRGRDAGAHAFQLLQGSLNERLEQLPSDDLGYMRQVR